MCWRIRGPRHSNGEAGGIDNSSWLIRAFLRMRQRWIVLRAPQETMKLYVDTELASSMPQSMWSSSFLIETLDHNLEP